ncbi:hypothetical protein E4Q23_13240 [Candidatus Accumulibacter phosphatis]|uniref:protein acetyllysine N-acetyltransferase n=2 Tax=Candidatus Accumulibacter phosphatis TaxID=327160 RepID=A0ABX1TWI0_9PROT|nr:hypothetical protein [Candidatus Accumulibacter phosphatis]
MPRDEHRKASHDAEAGPADQLSAARGQHSPAVRWSRCAPTSPLPANHQAKDGLEGQFPGGRFWQSTASTGKERKMQSNSLASGASLLRTAKGIVVFSGAGLSADSGIPAFRDGETGLWNTVDPDEVARIEGFPRHPARVWSWLLELKKWVDERQPNAAHQALARLQETCRGKRLTVITQNIDNYHSRAGNAPVLEVHRTIHHRRRCQQHCGFTTKLKQAA